MGLKPPVDNRPNHPAAHTGAPTTPPAPGTRVPLAPVNELGHPSQQHPGGANPKNPS